MREYAREVAQQGQPGGGVTTTAATQPSQPQHIARSQLFQRASALVTAFLSGMAWQLSEINGYYSGLSTGKEHKKEGNEDSTKELSDNDEVEDEGLSDSSAEEEEESEIEEEWDTYVDEEEREKKVRSSTYADTICLHRQQQTEDGWGDQDWWYAGTDGGSGCRGFDMW